MYIFAKANRVCHLKPVMQNYNSYSSERKKQKETKPIYFRNQRCLFNLRHLSLPPPHHPSTQEVSCQIPLGTDSSMELHVLNYDHAQVLQV